MPISQTKIQIQFNKLTHQYDCVINSFVNGKPFQMNWGLDPVVLELATDLQIVSTIAPMIRNSLEHKQINFSHDDLKELAEKMLKGMHTHVPVKKKNKSFGSKPVAVPDGWGPGKPNSNVGQINGKGVNELSNNLPGMKTKVELPCTGCPAETDIQFLMNAIIHLNDAHNSENSTDKWPRERIADWLDELHDSGKVNLEFQPWNSEGKEENGNGN